MKRHKAVFKVQARMDGDWIDVDVEPKNTAHAKRMLKDCGAGDYRVIQLRGEFTVETETMTKATVTPTIFYGQGKEAGE